MVTGCVRTMNGVCKLLNNFILPPCDRPYSRGGGGGTSIYAYWVCAARETPIFSPEFPFRSIFLCMCKYFLLRTRTTEMRVCDLLGSCLVGKCLYYPKLRYIQTTILHNIQSQHFVRGKGRWEEMR